MIAPIVYLLCASTCLVCAILLFRAYRTSGFTLWFWSGVCFAAFTLNNILLFVDLMIFPQIDLLLWRNLSALIGVLALLLSLIWSTH